MAQQKQIKSIDDKYTNIWWNVKFLNLGDMYTVLTSIFFQIFCILLFFSKKL